MTFSIQMKLHTTVLSDYTYNNLGEVVTDANALDTFTYTYQPNSRIPTGYSSVNGPSTAYSYKSAIDNFMLDKIVNRDSSSGITSEFEYDFDVLGRITNWKQSIAGLSLDQEFLSSYDAKGQMTELIVDDATPQLPTWNWQFDKAGNRINEQLATSAGIKRQAHTINTRDQIESIASGGAVHLKGQLNRPGMIEDATPPTKTPTDGAGNFSAWIPTDSLTSATVTAHDFSSNVSLQATAITPVATPEYEFEYDDNGNMTEMTVTPPGGPSETTYYYWDALDRLAQVYAPADTSVFEYDGLGRMVKLTDYNWIFFKETELNFVWNGLQRVRQTGFRYLDGVNKTYFPHGVIYNNMPYFTVTDHLGSVRGISDGTGVELATYSYDAYGNFDHDSYDLMLGLIQDNYYTGHYYHAVSGLYLAPYRAYDPKLGRWLSREPLGLDGPNLYHYTFNNSLLYTDPTGLWVGFDDALFGGGGFVFGVGGQLLSDIFTGKRSSWETYVGAGVGGSATGMTLLYTANPVLAGAAGGASSNFATQFLEKLSGKRCHFNLAEFLGSTLIGAGTGYIPGRAGSSVSLFKQMVTKFKRGLIKNMRRETSWKIYKEAVVGYALPQGAFFGPAVGEAFSILW